MPVRPGLRRALGSLRELRGLGPRVDLDVSEPNRGAVSGEVLVEEVPHLVAPSSRQQRPRVLVEGPRTDGVHASGRHAQAPAEVQRHFNTLKVFASVPAFLPQDPSKTDF